MNLKARTNSRKLHNNYLASLNNISSLGILQ